MPPTTHMAPPRPISLDAIFGQAKEQKVPPSIDLEWEPFRDHVDSFLRAIDRYAQKARENIANEARDHVDEVRDLEAQGEEMERRIQLEKEKEVNMLAVIQKERQTLAELQSSLNTIQQSLGKTREQSAVLEAELTAVRKDVTSQRSEKERQEATLRDMRSRDVVELDEMEGIIGWSIVGAGKEHLLNRFTLVDPDDPAREFSFVIDISKEEYSVISCSPPVPSIPTLVQQLNTDRDFFGFIKQVRKAFRALVVPTLDSTPSPYDTLAGPGVVQPNSRTKGTDTVTDGVALGSLKL